jgi:hypothetical protein
MIDPSLGLDFPNNFVHCLAEVYPALDEDGDLVIQKRPLRPTDPNYSVGIYGTLWQPDEESYEIGHEAVGEPTLSRYQVGVQSLIKDGDTQRGLAVSSILAKRLRVVLYRNQPLRLALGSLVVQDGAFKESMRRWGVRSQRFMSNDIEGTFVTISVMDLWLETESS